MLQPPWADVVASFARECARAGLDLVHPFAAADYNEHVPSADRLRDFGRARALAILVGNTRALWPTFVDSLEASESAAVEHPLDAYVTRQVTAAANATNAHFSCLFAHVTSPRALPIQRLAERVGFAVLAPSHLLVHHEHGPWLALRAVVTFDVDGPASRPEPATRPCQSCSAPCVPALERALSETGSPLDRADISRHAAEWIAVRDACPVGKASRYGEAQLAYHYGVERRPRHGS